MAKLLPAKYTNWTRQYQSGRSHRYVIRSTLGGFAGAGIYRAIGKLDECMGISKPAHLLRKGFGHGQAIVGEVHELDEAIPDRAIASPGIRRTLGGFASAGIYPSIGKPDECMRSA